MQLISIAIDIGYNSPRCFPTCAAIVSKLLSKLPTKKEKLVAVDRIRKGSTNCRITDTSRYGFSPKLTYGDKLCGLVEGKKMNLWNDSWISDTGLKRTVRPNIIVNKKRLKVLRSIVSRAEYALLRTY